VDPEGETPEGDLRTEPREAGRNTEAERGQTDAGNPDGTGSVHSATVNAGADADLGAEIQRAQLWVPARTKRTRRRASRAAVRAGREGLGGGYRYRQVLRPRQSRHPGRANRGSDSGQAGVGIDREVPAAGSDGGGVGGSQRRGDAARGPVITAAGQHLSGCVR